MQTTIDAAPFPRLKGMAQSNHRPSEYDRRPGAPTSQADRDALARRDAARKAGAPVPPVARPYNGWERR